MKLSLRVFLDDSKLEKVCFRFPKTKKKRIVKKWRNNPKNNRMIPKHEKVVTLSYDKDGFYVVTHPVNRHFFEQAIHEGVLDGTFIYGPKV